MSKRSSKKGKRKIKKSKNTLVFCDWNSAGEEFYGITKQEALNMSYSQCTAGSILSFIFNSEAELIDFDTEKVLHKWLILDNDNVVKVI